MRDGHEGKRRTEWEGDNAKVKFKFQNETSKFVGTYILYRYLLVDGCVDDM